ncbi:MAG: MoaD/ThiS family protein [Anaerolineales bacterium]
MRLYLGGYLNFYNPQHGNWLVVDINQPSHLKEVLVELGIPVSDVYLVVLNGQLVELSETIVSGEDEVKLYPAVGGG